MKALKYYVSMLITCALIMGIGSSAYGKDNQSKGKVSTTTVRGEDGNKRAGTKSSEKMFDTVTSDTVTKEGGGKPKDVASDRNQDEMSVKTGSTTPVGQLQATGLKQVEDISCSLQEMRNFMKAIDSKQDELRKDVERFLLVRNGVRLGDVSPFFGAIVVILMLMVIVGVYWWLNWLTVKQLEGIKRNSSGGAFNDEQINKMTQKIVEILPRSSGNGTQTYVNITRGQIDDIAGKVSEKLGLSKKLEDVVKMHFGTVAEKLAGSAGKMETLQSSVRTLGEETSKITSATEDFKQCIDELIRSLNETKRNIVTEINNVKDSFCKEEAVRVLPDVQKLINELSGALTETNTRLQKRVYELEENAKKKGETIGVRDETIKQLEVEKAAKDAELQTEQTKHKEDNTKNEADIGRLKGEIDDLYLNLTSKVNKL